MTRSFVYPPNDPCVTNAIRKLAKEQWAKWQSSNIGKGVVWGPNELPGETHPDINEEYDALPAHIQDFANALTYGRVMIFAKLGAKMVKILIKCAQERVEIPTDLAEHVAGKFHLSWCLLRRAWGLSGHHGDKRWEDENEAERWNDLKLVPGWADLLSGCSTSADPDFVALMKFILEE